MPEISENQSILKENKEDYIPKERYTLRHKASTFSCYVSPEEKEQRLSKKETKTKKLIKKIFGF